LSRQNVLKLQIAIQVFYSRIRDERGGSRLISRSCPNCCDW